MNFVYFLWISFLGFLSLHYKVTLVTLSTQKIHSILRYVQHFKRFFQVS